MENIYEFRERLNISEADFSTRIPVYEKVEFYSPIFIDYEASEDNKALQKGDVDVSAIKDGNTTYISEKIRLDREYTGDILVEVYSVFETLTPGWLKNSIANWLFCFFKDKAVCVNEHELKQFCRTFFTRENIEYLKTVFAEMIKEGKKGKLITLNGVKMFACNTSTKSKGGTYHTVSVCVPSSLLVKNNVHLEIIDY